MPDERRELPLFPLHTVLFPGMTLPLRVFEARYLQMVGDCLGGEQAFGVVLIREGKEVGPPAAPYLVGTTARIIGVEKKSRDVIHLTTVGEERFRIHHLIEQSGKPYLVGVVEPYPLGDAHAPEVGALTDITTAILSVYLDLLSEVNGLDIKLQSTPETTETIAYLAAALLQVPLSTKQQLLSVADLPTLLRVEADLLRGEVSALTVSLRGQEVFDSERPPFGFSTN
jgi:Lon protease-like protein